MRALSRVGVVDIGSLIASAGQNFFLIYGMSALALVKLGRTTIEKAFGLISLMIVAGLALYAGDGLIYPLLLIGAALLVRRATQTPLADVAPAE